MQRATLFKHPPKKFNKEVKIREAASNLKTTKSSLLVSG